MSDMTNKTLTLKKRPCSTETPQQTTISFRRNRKTIVHVTQTPTGKKKKPLPQTQKQPQTKIKAKSKPPVLPKEKQKKPVKAPHRARLLLMAEAWKNSQPTGQHYFHGGNGN